MALGNPLIAVEFEGVSLRFGAAQSPSEIADSVVGVLDKLGVARACVVGHSFGERVVHSGREDRKCMKSQQAHALRWTCRADAARTHARCVCRLRLCFATAAAGTFIAACLARRYPQRVHHICLMDAVCFGMFMPNLLKNFVYRLPELRGWTLRE